MPTYTHSSETRVAVGESGTEQDISGNVDNSYFESRVGVAENTPYGATAVNQNPTLGRPVVYLTGPWDVALHAIVKALEGVKNRGIVYSPAGTQSGEPKIAGSGFYYGYRVFDGGQNQGKRWECWFAFHHGYSDTGHA